MAEEKLRKRSGFEIYSYFKDSTLPQQLKAVQGSKLGMWRYNLSIEGIQKGCPFCQKCYITERVRGLPNEQYYYNSCFETFTLNFTSPISHSIQIN